MSTLPAFRLIGDRLLVRRDIEQAQTAAGLHIPETARDKLQAGEVVKVGPGVRADGLEPGARVVFGKYSEQEIALDGATFLILRESSILGVEL